MADLFISYSHADRAFASQLYDELRRFKVRGFMDTADIAIGADFSRQLREAIEKSDALVVVLSQAVTKSSFVLAEVGMAQGLGKRVLPVLAPGAQYDESVPAQLLDQQVVDANLMSVSEVAARIVAAATNTSFDGALQQVRSEAARRQRRLFLLSAILATMAVIAFTAAVVANRQRYTAELARAQAEGARIEAVRARSLVEAASSQGALAIAPDGRLVAIGRDDGTVSLVNLSSGALVTQFRLEGGPIGSLAYSPDGKALAAAGWNGRIQVLDIETGHLVQELVPSGESILAVQFSPDGRLVVARSIDGIVRVWERETGRLSQRINPPR